MQSVRTVPTVAEDETELRSVIEAYFSALRNKDWQRLDELEAKRTMVMILNGSDSHGPMVSFNASLELTKRLLTPYNVATASFSIDKLEIKVQEAIVHVTLSMTVVEPSTGTMVIDFVNLQRMLHLDKYQSSWKLNSDSADGSSLAAQVKKARTSIEREFLFSQEDLPELSQARESFKRDGVTLIEQGTLEKSFVTFGLAQEIDNHIRVRSAVASELRSKQREAKIAEFRASGKLKDLALNLLWAGQDYAELRDFSKAEKYLEESTRLLEQLGDREDLAKAHQEIAAVYLEEGKYSQAVTSYENSIAKYLLVCGEGKEDRSFLINDIDDAIIRVAGLYSAQGKYDLAEKFVQENSEKLKVLGEAEDAMLLSYIVAILKMARADNVHAAEDLLLRINQSPKVIEDKDEVVAGTRLILTMLYAQQSNFAAAAKQFERMREAKIETEDAVGWSNLLELMDGLVYGAQGNERLMVSRFKNLMPTLTHSGLEELNVSDVLQVSCMSNLSKTLFEDEIPQNDVDLALRCFQFSATMAEKSKDVIHAARAYQFMAALYANKRNYPKEIEYSLKAVALLEDGPLQFKERYVARAMIDNLLLEAGGAYGSMGNYEKAIATYRKTLDQNALRLFRFYDSRTLLRITEASYAFGKFEEATNYGKDAIRAATRNGDRETLKDAYLLAGKAHLALKQTDLARQSYRAAINTVETLRPQVPGSEQNAAQFFEHQLAPYQVMVDFLLAQGKKEEALSYADRSKSKVLLDSLKNGRKSTSQSMTDLEQKQEYDLRRKLVVLNRQVIQAQAAQPGDSESRQLRIQRVEARLNYELFRNRLYVNHPELTEHLDYGRETIHTKDVGQLLRSPSDAILEFMVTEKKLILFVVTKANVRQGDQPSNSIIRQDIDCEIYELNIGEDELKTLIDQFRIRVAHPEGVVDRRARELYDLLLGKAQSQLAGMKTLIIIPDGILWNLPFQALMSSEGRYLLEDFAIYYVPSLTALREMQKLSERNSLLRKSSAPDQIVGPARLEVRMPSLLAVGNPTVCENEDCNRAPYRSSNFAPLWGSERLAKKLSVLYGPNRSRLFVGKLAQEATIKREASNYEVIHIGAHGVFDNENPIYSFLALSPSGGAKSSQISDVPTGVEDGFLEVWELMDLQLKAELMILSSCDTARGEVRKGEGIVGFSWAALLAGCPTVIVGQWEVDETATSELMYDFHKRWRVEKLAKQAHINVASNLQQSALALLRNKKYSHPYYWAGFTTIGVGH